MKQPLFQVVKLKSSLILINILKDFESRFLSAYRINDCLTVIISLEGPAEQLHISIAHAHRYPTWDEIKAIKYHFYPDLNMALYLPPAAEYVNIHENCFHLFESGGA